LGELKKIVKLDVVKKNSRGQRWDWISWKGEKKEGYLLRLLKPGGKFTGGRLELFFYFYVKNAQ